MKSYIKISIRLLSVIGFIIATYICYTFFQIYITDFSLSYSVILISLSFMLLKSDLTLLIYEKFKEFVHEKYDILVLGNNIDQIQIKNPNGKSFFSKNNRCY